MTMPLYLVGSRHLFVAGLARILREAPFDVAIEAASLSGLPAVAVGPGLVVVDKPRTLAEIEPDIRALKERAPACRVVVIARDLDREEMVTAFAAGIDGYLLEEISPEALRESLRLVMVGEKVFPSQLVALLSDRAWVARAATAQALPEASLSEREAAIVVRLAEGLPNKVIASELTITEATVKVHLKSILKKLGVANRTQAAVWAINHGLTGGTQATIQ